MSNLEPINPYNVIKELQAQVKQLEEEKLALEKEVARLSKEPENE